MPHPLASWRIYTRASQSIARSFRFMRLTAGCRADGCSGVYEGTRPYPDRDSDWSSKVASHGMSFHPGWIEHCDSSSNVMWADT